MWIRCELTLKCECPHAVCNFTEQCFHSINRLKTSGFLCRFSSFLLSKCKWATHSKRFQNDPPLYGEANYRPPNFFFFPMQIGRIFQLFCMTHFLMGTKSQNLQKKKKKPVHEDKREQNLGGESREWELMCANERDREIEKEREEKRRRALYSII